VLGQVVVQDQGVLALEHEVLAHRAAGVRRHPLDRGGLGGGGVDDDRVLHRPLLLQLVVHLRDGRALLPDGDVHADQVLVPLVEDRVDEDRRLAGGAVADDQLALAAPDRDHRVDRLEARLHRLLHGLALDHAWCLELERPVRARLDRPLAVDGLAEGVDDPPDQLRPYRDARDRAGALHRLAFLDVLPIAEERDADVVLLEVEGEACDAVLELEHLRRDTVFEAVDVGDPVADLQDGADLGEVGLDVVLLDPLLEDRGDLFGT
jgi:hypothetical protein